MTIAQTVDMAVTLSTEALDKLKPGGSIRIEINSVIQNAFDTMINTVQSFIDYVLAYVRYNPYIT